MYNRNQNLRRSSGGNSFHRSKRSYGGNKTSAPIPNAGAYSVIHARPKRAGGNNNRGQYIPPSKFICKAKPEIESKPYEPTHAWEDFNLHPHLHGNVARKGYCTPTPIQDQAIPHVMKGLDVVGIANTGTGKTAAFLLPLLHKVMADPKENVLIIVPTRELAQQINDEFMIFRAGLNIFSACCVGGANINQQIQALRRPNNFVIGTPGRLKDLIERKVLNPVRFNTLVMDEADRMLDMGFVPDMRFIMGKMPVARHTLCFSATTTPEVNRLINEFLREPITVSVKTGETAKNVDQDIVHMEGDKSKITILHEMLAQPEFKKVLVFGRTKYGVEKLAKELSRRGFKAESIHGNKTQGARQKALHAFKNNIAHILVATDVAARGLDIPNVSHVINYDVPATYEDYVHRIGRTGRAGEIGKAFTFIE